MSSPAAQEQQQQQQAQQQQHQEPNSAASSSSSSSSASLIKLDELSSYGATKRNRLPALLKLNPLADQNSRPGQQSPPGTSSMPDFSGSQLDKTIVSPPGQQAESLPASLAPQQQQQQQPRPADKENSAAASLAAGRTADESDDFQVVEMDEGELQAQAGPSLPAVKAAHETRAPAAVALQNFDAKSLSAQLQSTSLAGPYASNLGDSLIEMIINLRNENQNLVRALETNNDYVKERLSEFKRCQEEAKKRELQFALEKAELEHQARKLQRQNSTLSERLKNMEAKLRDMRLEVSESLNAASSSKASSLHNDQREEGAANLYPELGAAGHESFANPALSAPDNQASTMPMETTSDPTQKRPDASSSDDSEGDSEGAMDTGEQRPAVSSAERVGAMSREELNKRFDASKAEFYALDDPMKQCDQLEQQLNDIGKRDYEICLLQQQLNIYRQDFRLERMAKLEAKIQIEKLKSDIDRLCLERVQERDRELRERRPAHDVRFGPTTSLGRLGHHLGRKAARSAAKAARYASKQAHLEEKAAAALARATAATSRFAQHQAPQAPADPQLAPGGSAAPAGVEAPHQNRGHHGHHHRVHRQRGTRSAMRSEVVNDLLSTANKAMLTGYKMASTHVNLALDKLSQFEQQQAGQLDPNNRPPIQQTSAAGAGPKPSAPPTEPLSVD